MTELFISAGITNLSYPAVGCDQARQLRGPVFPEHRGEVDGLQIGDGDLLSGETRKLAADDSLQFRHSILIHRLMTQGCGELLPCVPSPVGTVNSALKGQPGGVGESPLLSVYRQAVDRPLAGFSIFVTFLFGVRSFRSQSVDF